MSSVRARGPVGIAGRFILALLLGLASTWSAVVAAPAPANRPVKDKWALVVGISKFENPALNLKYPAKDAQDLYDFLVADGRFERDHVKLLLNEEATRANILSVLGGRWLPRAAHPDDLVLIYISSHGSPANLDVGGVNYILAHDTDLENLYATGIPMQDLARIIKGRVHSDRVVVVLDACHSGAATPEAKGVYVSGNVNVDEVVQGTGQLVISSSAPSQISWESKDKPNSVFTRHFIDGLKLKGQSTTLSDAFNYMKEKVESEVLAERGVMQTPVLKSKWEGSDVMLAVAPLSPRPAPKEAAATLVASRSQAKNIARTGAPPPVEIAGEPVAPAVPLLRRSASPPGDSDVFGPLKVRKQASQAGGETVPAPALALTPAALSPPEPSPGRQPADDSKAQSWWSEFQKKETAETRQIASAEPSAPPATGGPPTAGGGDSPVAAGAVRQGYFMVPSYFAGQPEPYSRPAEVVRSAVPLSTSADSAPGLDMFRATLPWVTRGGLAPLMPVPYWGGPAALLPGAFYGPGHHYSFGYPAYGYPAYGYPAYGYPAYGFGGAGSAALWAGAFARPASRLPGVTPSRVFQTAPSKASGNYYAPATQDRSASGSYYATGTPAMTPAFVPQKPITNFWGAGDPYSRDATMPWNR